MKDKIITFKGIKFYNYNINQILSKLKNGGYLVAPAASALAKINENKNYYNSLKESKVAIFDSGFFCILLRIFKNYEIKKFSGFLFIQKFLKLKKIKNKKILLVDPSKNDSYLNKLLLNKKKFHKVQSYVAPLYKKGKIKDLKLLKLVKKYKPDFIIINIGGEIQEVLANFLYFKLKNKTIIICTGAAIGFMTKTQAPINNFLDKYYLGWLVRVTYNPKKFFFRVIKSFSLINLFIKN